MNNILNCQYCGDYYSLKYLTECPRCKERKDLNAKAKEQEDKIAVEIAETIAILAKNWDKQPIVDVLFYVQEGRISCRKAAELLIGAAFRHHCEISGT